MAAEGIEDIHEQNEASIDTRSIGRVVPPQEMLRCFSDTLDEPKLLNKLNKRRFLFVETMEGAEALTTDPRRTAVPLGGSGDVEMIVQRMVRYCRAHNYDKDESRVIRIFNALHSHLRKVRGLGDGTVYDLQQLTNLRRRSQKLEEMAQVQNELNRLGVTNAALTAVATHPAGIEGNAADVGLELLQELILYGNATVQNAIIDYMHAVDKDSHVLNYLKGRMVSSLFVINERKARTKRRFRPMNELQKEEYVNAQQTFQLLKGLCEGHNASCQNMLREQPQHQGDVNVIKFAAEMVTSQAEDANALRRMEEGKFFFSTRSMHSRRRSRARARRGRTSSARIRAISTMDAILGSPFNAHVSKETRLDVKTTALTLLAGRSNEPLLPSSTLIIFLLLPYATTLTPHTNPIGSTSQCSRSYQPRVPQAHCRRARAVARGAALVPGRNACD